MGLLTQWRANDNKQDVKAVFGGVVKPAAAAAAAAPAEGEVAPAEGAGEKKDSGASAAGATIHWVLFDRGSTTGTVRLSSQPVCVCVCVCVFVCVGRWVGGSVGHWAGGPCAFVCVCLVSGLLSFTLFSASSATLFPPDWRLVAY